MVGFDRTGKYPKVVLTPEETAFFKDELKKNEFYYRIAEIGMSLGVQSEHLINDATAVAEAQTAGDIPYIGSDVLMYGYNAGLAIQAYSRKCGGPIAVKNALREAYAAFEPTDNEGDEINE